MPLLFLLALAYIMEVVIHFLWGWVRDPPPTVQTVHWGFKSSVRHCGGSYFQTVPSQKGGHSAPPAFSRHPWHNVPFPQVSRLYFPGSCLSATDPCFRTAFHVLLSLNIGLWCFILFVCFCLFQAFDKLLDYPVHIIAILTTYHISLTLNFKSSIY